MLTGDFLLPYILLLTLFTYAYCAFSVDCVILIKINKKIGFRDNVSHGIIILLFMGTLCFTPTRPRYQLVIIIIFFVPVVYINTVCVRLERRLQIRFCSLFHSQPNGCPYPYYILSSFKRFQTVFLDGIQNSILNRFFFF